MDGKIVRALVVEDCEDGRLVQVPENQAWPQEARHPNQRGAGGAASVDVSPVDGECQATGRKSTAKEESQTGQATRAIPCFKLDNWGKQVFAVSS
jgi:hypothetical protein